MPTEHDTTETPDAAPDVAVGALESGHRSDDTDPTAGAAQIDGEAALREWEGLPPDAVILVPAFAAPMRLPDQTWAMLVLAVDIAGDTDPDRAGDVELFAGSWVPDQPPADLYDGDLVVRLTQPGDPAYPRSREHAVDIEMLLARRGRWQLVGRWGGVDECWPWLLAPTAAVVMGLHCDAVSTLTRELASPTETTVPLRWASGGVGDLLDAGLVKAGDELVWHRRNQGVRHTARIRIDGTIGLADGRVYANPSGAATALGGNHQNGWSAFRRVSDGRTLGELRTELWARRGR
jgi:hypothetical protein